MEAIVKKKKRRSNSKMKARNFLTQITYSRIKKDDCTNKELINNVFTLLTQNMNPLSSDKTFLTDKEQELVYILWE